jgi:DNA-binding response OmpR family regulator
LDENRTTVLIIEDNPDMQGYIAGVLSQNYQCVIADNGQIGVEKALEIIPDLIVSDVMMPVMDGFESTKLIKEDERTSHIPVIMLTARGDKDSRMTGWKSLADEYLSKPFDEEELELRVSNLLSIRAILKRKFIGSIGRLGEGGLLKENQDAEVVLSDKDAKFIHKIDEILAQRYQDENFTINEVAEALFMSRRQLLRKLKAVADFTPQEYLRYYRLQKAAELLKLGRRVTDVSIAIGFTSQSHFSTCFKAQFEMTPKGYQIQHRAAAEAEEAAAAAAEDDGEERQS